VGKEYAIKLAEYVAEIVRSYFLCKSNTNKKGLQQCDPFLSSPHLMPVVPDFDQTSGFRFL